MAVSLTKIINGKLTMSDTLLNEQSVKCPSCDQTYRLGYSDAEWHRLKDWLKLAEQTLREDHKTGHENQGLSLQWKHSGTRRS